MDNFNGKTGGEKIMFFSSLEDGESVQTKQMSVLVDQLLLAVQNSNILFDLEDISALQSLKTNIGFYITCQADPQASKWIVAMQKNLPQIRKYFSGSREHAEITKAINALEEALSSTMSGSAKPSQNKM